MDTTCPESQRFNSPRYAIALKRELDRIRDFNDGYGTLTGLDCAKCKNKGYIATLSTIASYPCMVAEVCTCQKSRKALGNIERSGLKNALDFYSMDSFKTDTEVAKHMMNVAQKFLHSADAWLYAGGQVGAGKTHICTAICGELLNRGKEVVYMMWRDDSVRLKQLMNSPDYDDAIEKFKYCEVLYIDDLFKPVGDKANITGPDISLLFEIINSRYASNRRTIVSSERTLNELMEIDDAIGSRIYQKSKGHTIVITKDRARNRRIHDSTM